MSSISSGTTSTTGYVVSSDTTGALVLKTGSSATTAVTIDTSQNVGVGTGSPATKLNIENAGACQLQMAFSSTIFGRVGRLSSGNYEFSSYENGGSLLFGTTNTNGATTTRLEIDRYGNAGLGVTPSAWTSSNDALQFGSFGVITSSQETTVYANAYRNAGADHIYLTSSLGASFYDQYNGVHAWNIAGTGTAGNVISFTQAMVLNSSGNLGVGTTSPATRIHAVATGGAIRMQDTTATAKYIQMRSDATNSHIEHIGGPSDALRINNQASGSIEFFTANTERMRITDAGFVGIGTSTPALSLEVVGQARATTLLVLNGGTPTTPSNTTPTFFSPSSGVLGIVTNGSERARIQANGSLLVGWSGGSYDDPGYNNAIGFALENPSTSCTIKMCATDSHYFYRVGTGNVQRFEYKATLATGATNVGSISITASATAYNTSSDYRLKNTITPMTGALARVALLKPVTYKWNVNGSDGQGFIAHELAEVVPDCVTGEKDAIDADGKPQYQGIDVSFLVATLTAAIQEQQALIQQLQADVAILKGAQQ